MKRNTTRGGIGRFLGLLAVIVAVLAVMTVSAAAAEYDVGSTKDLLDFVGGSYIDENGETVAVEQTKTLAANDTILITNDFELTATASIAIPVKLNIRSKDNAENKIYTIKRTQGEFPMFTLEGQTVFLRDIVIDGDDIEGTADGGAFYGTTSSSYLYLYDNVTLKNLKAVNGGAAYVRCIVLNGKSVTENCAASADGGAYYTTLQFTLKGGAIIRNNTAAANGGAVCTGESTSKSAYMILSDGVIEGNTANGDGGGVYYAFKKVATETVFSGVTIQNNKAVGVGVGGGIYIGASADGVVINGTTLIKSNTAFRGGGIYSKGDMTLDGDMCIDSNVVMFPAGAITTTNPIGGGLVVDKAICVMTGNARITANYTTQEDATKAGRGGGVYTSGGATFVMLGGSIDGNKTANTAYCYGGAIYSAQGNVYLIGGSITNNEASQYGAIYMSHPADLLYLLGTSVNNNAINGATANSSQNGAAVYAGNGTTYLLGGEITGNVRKGAKGKEYVAAIVASANGTIVLNSSVTLDSIPEAMKDLSIVTAVTDETEAVIGYTIKPSVPLNIHDNNNNYSSASIATATNITLVGNLVKGSHVELESDAVLALAAGFTPNQATLDAICLRGAHTLYNPEQSNATLVWGDETYQIIQQAGLADEIFFRVTYAFRDKATVAEFTVSGADHTEISSDAGHCFTFKLAPKQLMDEITITYDAEATYTLGAYLTDLKAQDPSTVDIVNALINYCDAAQAYFQYTPNGYYTGEKPAVPELPDDLTTNLTDEVLKNSGFSGARLVADSKIALSFIIEDWTGDEAALKAITVSGNGAVDFGADTKNGDLYVVIPLSAANYADYYTVKVGDAEVTYGVRDYLVRMKKYEKELPLVKALYAYCVAAQAYSPIQG